MPKLGIRSTKRKPDKLQREYFQFTDQLLADAEKLYSLSNTCDYLGIDIQGLKEWWARYPQELKRYKQAKAKGVRAAHDLIQGGAKAWIPLLTMLERRSPEDYSRNNPGRPKDDTSPFERYSKRKS